MQNVSPSQIKSIADLVPDKKNARKHNPRNIGMITDAIGQVGVGRSGVIDEDGNILVGNGTYEALAELGIEKVKVVKAAGNEWVVVQREGLSEEQKVKMALYDNRTAELADWDIDVLKDIDIELPDVLENLFQTQELDELLDLSDIGPLQGEDEVPEAPEKAVTQPGQIYQLGSHRLMCGDSTDKSQVEKLMNGEQADMVFTDPPYNINYGNIKHPKFKVRSIANDDMGPDEFKAFCLSFADSIARYCDGCIYVFGHPGPDGRIMFSALDSIFHCSTTIIWNKDQFTLGRGKYQNKYEPCWFGWNKDGSKFTDDRTLTNVWDHDRPKSSELHPTMKPVGLIEIAVNHASNRKDSVLDLFGGSGSTLIACEKLNRKCCMMEIDPAYCDVVVERYKSLFPENEVRTLN